MSATAKLWRNRARSLGTLFTSPMALKSFQIVVLGSVACAVILVIGAALVKISTPLSDSEMARIIDMCGKETVARWVEQNRRALTRNDMNSIKPACELNRQERLLSKPTL